MTISFYKLVILFFLKISGEISAVLAATRGPPVRIYNVLLGKADEVFFIKFQYGSCMIFIHDVTTMFYFSIILQCILNTFKTFFL